MNKASKIIGVLPLGETSGAAVKVIMAHISGFLNLAPAALAARGLPGRAFDEMRLQYDAAILLERLEAMDAPGRDKVIGVTGADLFIPIFTHVFGEARQGGKAAVVSLHRLAEGADEARFLERAAKVALHELGHLFDLTHCTDSKCLMHFSGDLADLDASPLIFCRYCTAFFRENLSRP